MIQSIGMGVPTQGGQLGDSILLRLVFFCIVSSHRVKVMKWDKSKEDVKIIPKGIFMFDA